MTSGAASQHTDRLIGGRYRLLRRLAQGGMGAVWEGRDELLGRDVAVKEVIPPAGLDAGSREELHQRTLREARAAARIVSPYAVTVYDVVDADDQPWVVMELLRTRSLAEVLREEGPLPADRVAVIGLRILAALEAAAAAGVLHRDVKPSNVMVRGEADAVLTDFGIATLEGDPSLTASGALIGSPAYLAPERARGEPATLASDLWSLGVTLYAAVEGHSPFEREGALPTLAAVVDAPMPEPRHAGALAPVLRALLAKDPAQRPDVVRTRELLERAAAEPAPQPAPPGAGPSDDLARTRPIPVVAPAPPAVPGGAPTAIPAAAPTAAPAAPAPAGPAPTSPAPAAARTAGPWEPRSQTEIDPPVDGPPAAAHASHRYDPIDDSEDDRSRPGVLVLLLAVAAVVLLAFTGWRTIDVGGSDSVAFDPQPGAVEPEGAEGDGPAAATEESAGGDQGGGDQAAEGQPSEDQPAEGESAVGSPAQDEAAADEAAAGEAAAGGGASGGGGPGRGEEDDGAGRERGEDARGRDEERGGGQAGRGAAAVPAGFSRYDDPTGFSVVVPEGWEAANRRAEGSYTTVRLRDPESGAFLQVDGTTDPSADPYQDWVRQEAGVSQRLEDYELLRLERVEYRGWEAADWEFRHEAGGTERRVLNRNIRVDDDRAHALLWSVPEDRWDEYREAFSTAARSFRPAP